jgi:hypothetical protein
MSVGVIRSSVAQLGLAELLLQRGEFLADDRGDARGLGQDVQQIVDLRHHLLVFGDDLVLLQAGEALQPHLQDFLRLRVRQTIQAVAAHPEFPIQPVGPVIVGVDHPAIGAGAREHLAHQLAVPGTAH